MTTAAHPPLPSKLVLAMAVFGLLACGRTAIRGGYDASQANADLGPDTPGDMRAATPTDVRPDIGSDLARDAAFDLARDAAFDLARDAAFDLGRDLLGRDLASDAGPDRANDPPAEGNADRAADRSPEVARGIDLARPWDAGLPDRPPVDASLDTAGRLLLIAGALGNGEARDGVGAAARFVRPTGMAADGAGNLFVADPGSYTIRKVVIATGAVTTLAGRAGVYGITDGIGDAARFYDPTALALDGAGNLYVSETASHTIRKVVLATGAVTTLAGKAELTGSADGVGEEARFYHPLGMDYDGDGNLFVTDSEGTTIRKVSVVTGDVTTVAGSSGMRGFADGARNEALFDSLGALACDRVGNVFAVDKGAGTIRRLSTQTGTVSTLAGEPYAVTPTFGWMTDLTYEGTGNLVVADTGAPVLRRVAIATGAITTIASPEDAGAACPWVTAYDSPVSVPPGVLGVTSDRAGTLYVSVLSNALVCQLDVASKRVVKLAGALPSPGVSDGIGESARFAQPRSLASDGAGNLLVTTGAGTVRKLHLANAEVSTLAGQVGNPFHGEPTDGIGGAALFGDLRGAVSDRKGNLFVADAGDSTIRKIVLDTAVVTTLAGAHGRVGYQDGKGGDARFAGPNALAYDEAGLLYVTEIGAPTIRKVDLASGAVTTLAVVPPGSPFAQPAGLACDGAGNLLVADSANCAIYAVNLSTGALTDVAGSPGDCDFADGVGTAARFGSPADLVADGAGNLYVSDLANHAVRKIVLASGTVTTVVGSPAGASVVLGPLPGQLNGPAGLAFVPGTGLYISEANENAILLAELP